MKAVICMAGVGRRLLPLTDQVPKALLRIGEKTIIEYLLGQLSDAGIREAILVIGHGAAAVRAKLGTRFEQCHLTYVDNLEFASTNNIFSLWLAREHIADGMLFFNGDIIAHQQIIKQLVATEHRDAVVVDTNVALADDAMKVTLDAKKITAIGKRLQGAHGWAIGAYRLSPETSQQYFSIAEELFQTDSANKNISFVAPLQKLMETAPIMGVATDGYPWAEIDTHEDYQAALRRIDEIIL